jgi:hypothetical protein
VFALSFTSLALARIQQIKQVKHERKSGSSSAAKKSLVPDIARRGFAAFAVFALAASSAQAHGFGSGTGGGSGAGIYHGSSAGGFNMNSARQAQAVRFDAPVTSNFSKINTPVINSSNVQKTVPNFDSKPVKFQDGNQAKFVDKVNGNPNGAGVARNAFSKGTIDASRITNNGKPLELGKGLDAGKNLKLDKTADLGKNIVKPLGNNGGIVSKGTLSNSKSINSKLVDAVKAGKLDSLTKGSAATKLSLGDQYKLLGKGDVARRLNLSDKLEKNGGWQKRTCGPIDSHYCDHCKGQFYCGPKWCPHHCWCPCWCGWVEWCFGCPMWFDPRPDFCEPVGCDDCDVDETVVVDREGTPDSWVDDQPPRPAGGGAPADDVDVDLELVAIRFVDNGNAEKNLGPRYRVLIRNNGKQAVDHPFNVAVVTGAAAEQTDPIPRAGKRVPGIDAGQTLAVDIRLPADANATTKDDDGHTVERFPKLGAMVDTRNEIEESTKENNGMALERDKILMVDPAIFAADTKQATMGQTIKLAGEGLGPEAGQVLVRVGSLELQAEIEGWCDLGVEIKLPSLPLAGEAKAELVAVRGDGAAANPIVLKLAATQSAPPAPPEE